MHRLFGADRFAGELAGAVRDYFIRVGVGARARTGLENIERKMLVELPFHHLLRRLDDEGGAMRIEQAEIGVSLGSGPFNQAESADKGARKSITADRKIQDRALRGSAIERGCRHGHFAHGILLDSGRSGRHAERWFVESAAAGRR